MPKIIQNNLSIKNKIAEFNVIVRGAIAVIGGDNSTGKTLYFKEKQLYCQRHNDSAYFFINYSNMQDFLRIFDENVSNKIIFVDNADIIVPENIDIYRKISNSPNQFIFFGRDITKYNKNYDNWSELQEISKGKYRLTYVLKKAGVYGSNSFINEKKQPIQQKNQRRILSW